MESNPLIDKLSKNYKISSDYDVLKAKHILLLKVADYNMTKANDLEVSNIQLRLQLIELQEKLSKLSS